MNFKKCIICCTGFIPKIHNQKCCSKHCKRKRESQLMKINRKPERGGFLYKLSGL